MRLIIGIAEMSVTDRPDDLLVTHALGSCVGITIFDPVAGVGGILHYMLPLSSLDPAKAAKNPFMFGDSGIPEFFRRAYELGATKENLRVCMAGGANVIQDAQKFDIGSRNIVIARKLFWKNAVLIAGEHVGGSAPRTLYLDMATGNTWFTSGRDRVDL
ncbi:MAG: chemotaxis protein CheD [Fibrobacteria bacterium]|nr:chemotaxis protein CheD [Fibrobacteria bacterium]